MSVPTPEPTGPSTPGPTRLSGWKDIAAYLDRGVRTVQRWEKDYGLPVRRLGTGRGEGVFAFAHEVDAWQATAQAASARRDSQDATGDPMPDGAPGPSSRHAAPAGPAAGAIVSPDRRLRAALAVMAAAMVLTIAWAAWQTYTVRHEPPDAPAAAGAPASWRVEGNTLVALDATGRTCWTRQLPTLVDTAYYASQLNGAMGNVGDIDGDGRREVWFVAFPLNRDTAHAKLYVFNQDGTPRWNYQFAGQAAFGVAAYGGPWVVHRTFVTEAPEDPARQALWVSSRDGADFPSLLVRLDVATGKPVSGAYWSNGWVNALALLRSPDGPRLLLGVTNNEKVAPGLVLLDAANITGSTPAELPKYRCTSCPAGEPLAVVIFPKPRRFSANSGGGSVETIYAGDPAGPVVATATYANTRSGIAAAAVFRLDTGLTPLRADPADNYMPAYEQLVRDGEIPAFGPLSADPSSELLPVIRWDRATRRFVTARPATASR